MEQFHSVQRRVEAAVITTALVMCGVEIVAAADGTVAPLEYRVRLQGGEGLRLVCYAFSAGPERRAGRLTGRHGFRVGYGGGSAGAHGLYRPTSGREVTLMLGWHADREVFIGVDPAMHDPAWFPSRVTFGERDLDRAAAIAWHGWERERLPARLELARPEVSYQMEVLVGFRPERLGRFVELERRAVGLDAGERLLLVDRMGRAGAG